VKFALFAFAFADRKTVSNFDKLYVRGSIERAESRRRVSGTNTRREKLKTERWSTERGNERVV